MQNTHSPIPTSDVVILAAGKGTRLRPLTDDLSKCMVEVAGELIIERILSQLSQRQEVDNIFVLTGYKHEQLSTYLDEYFPMATCIQNKDYASTNNMYSLGLFFKKWNQEHDLIIVNADCVFEDQIVHNCVTNRGSCILTDSLTSLDESMKVKIDNNHVRAMSKNLDKKASNVKTSIDLYKFEVELATALSRIVKTYIDNEDLNQWTEVAINDLVSLENKIIEDNDIKGMKWFEIDTMEDLEKARKLFADVN